VATIADASRSNSRIHGRELALLLGVLTAFGPLSTDMYIPGLPSLEHSFGTSTAVAQLTFTACVLGMALGQVIVGPISDSYGRRRPLLWGLAVYTVASLLCAGAPSVWLLIVVRMIQGTAAAAGIVIARAVTRDLFTGTTAVRFYANLMLVFGVAPILAPAVGGQIIGLSGWRMVFVVLAGVGITLWLVVWRFFSETLPPTRRRTGGIGETVGSMRTLARDRVFGRLVLANTMVVALMMTYIGSAAFVFKFEYGYSARRFSVVFALNALGMVASGQICARLARRVGSLRLLRVGVSLAAVSGCGLLTAALAGHPLLAVLVCLFGMLSAVGIVMPTATVLAMTPHPEHAGSASGLLGLFGSALGAVSAPVVGAIGGGTIVPLAACMAAYAVLAGFVGLGPIVAERNAG
jgi:DHA1 family bicyclomycin/chloramphenicol resistance-like MFS transporter